MMLRRRRSAAFSSYCFASKSVMPLLAYRKPKPNQKFPKLNHKDTKAFVSLVVEALLCDLRGYSLRTLRLKNFTYSVLLNSGVAIARVINANTVR